jgi:hypothetical protein
VLVRSVRQSTAPAGAAKIVISCAGARVCAGTVRLETTVSVKVRQGKKLVTRHETVVVGSGRFSVADRKTADLLVRLSSKGKALLAKQHRLSLVVVIDGKRTGKHLTLIAKASTPAVKALR